MLLLACGLLPACSYVKISDVPSPFSDDIIYGEVLNEIRIEGNAVTDENVIRTVLASKVGEPYILETAADDRRWLEQLGIFTSLRFETIRASEGVVLVVKVTEINPYIPAPSFKITEENGLEIGAAISSPNLFGKAMSLSAWARVGGATNVGIRFRDAWVPMKDWRFGSRLDYFHMERWNPNLSFDETSDEFNYEILNNITTWIGWGPRVSYLRVKSDRPDITLDPDNDDRIPGLGAFVTLDTRDFTRYPTGGWWAQVLAMRHRGDADYWQGTFDVRHYRQLAGHRHSLAIYSLTTLTGGEVGVDYPSYLQFFLGGANTVRGWELGAREGKNQSISTIEYWWLFRIPQIYEFWFLKQVVGYQFAVFLDAGTAWTDGSDDFHRSWIGGGGIGLRLALPSMVVVRLDLAVGEKGVGVSLAVGSREKAEAARDRVR